MIDNIFQFLTKEQMSERWADPWSSSLISIFGKSSDKERELRIGPMSVSVACLDIKM